MSQKPNRLINETSPYLRQHAYNPVDWFPWGEEAFNCAKKENRPIFLSIGYSACHWCHVMERESFENDSIAEFMNSHFISIKVDREERPDIDQIYMHFVQITTGSGGWPMSVFLTPERKPFYGGTYFPPEDRYGRPGFMNILKSISQFYTDQHDKLQDHLQEVDKAYLTLTAVPDAKGIPSKSDFDAAVKKLTEFYEPEYGGIGSAPKFPAVQCFHLFLRQYKNTGDPEYLNMVEHTLQKMGRGGIFDQIGGGFARYSVDNEWLVPHFEKMLYDNAQLCDLYIDTYKVTKNNFYLNIARDILSFIEREMLSPEGGFYSSLDADSEGEEGKYYTWGKEEIIKILGSKIGGIFCACYDVTDQGNFETKNILRVKSDTKTLAGEFNTTESEINSIIEKGKKELLKLREKRVHPGLDDKVIVSWNGLMLSAFSRMYQVTQEERYSKIVRENIKFLQSRLVKNEKLLHTYKDEVAKQDAFLDDYAFLIAGLLDAYEALFNESYLKWAKDLIETVNLNFWDDNFSGYFYTSVNQEALFQRMKDDADQSIPSGTGIMLNNMLRMHYYTGHESFKMPVEDIFKQIGSKFKQNPYGYASYLNALDFYLTSPKEIIILASNPKNTIQTLKVVSNLYIPNKILISSGNKPHSKILNPEHLKGKKMIEARSTVYVCQNFTCSKPIVNLDELIETLK